MPEVLSSADRQEAARRQQEGAGNTAEAWCKRICTAWQNSVKSIIKTGQLLIEAKAKLASKGQEYKRLEELLPFSQRTIERLVKIAENRVISDPTHVSVLPASWGTLYQLAAQLTEDELEDRIERGLVTCNTERNHIPNILKGKSEEKVRQEKTRKKSETARVTDATAETEAADTSTEGDIDDGATDTPEGDDAQEETEAREAMVTAWLQDQKVTPATIIRVIKDALGSDKYKNKLTVVASALVRHVVTMLNIELAEVEAEAEKAGKELSKHQTQ